MNDDDVPIGRLLTRRETVTLLGMSRIGASVTVAMAPEHALAGGASSVAAQCVLLPEQTEGPYFVGEALNRSDIRSDPTSGASRKQRRAQCGDINAKYRRGSNIRDQPSEVAKARRLK